MLKDSPNGKDKAPDKKEDIALTLEQIHAKTDLVFALSHASSYIEENIGESGRPVYTKVRKNASKKCDTLKAYGFSFASEKINDLFPVNESSDCTPSKYKYDESKCWGENISKMYQATIHNGVIVAGDSGYKGDVAQEILSHLIEKKFINPKNLKFIFVDSEWRKDKGKEDPFIGGMQAMAEEENYPAAIFWLTPS